jgi:hypothetical protein
MKALRIAIENHVFELFRRDCSGILLKISNVEETLKVGYTAVMDSGTNEEVSQRMQDFARSKQEDAASFFGKRPLPPSTLVKMALTSTEQEMIKGDPTLLLRVTERLGEKVSTQMLMLPQEHYQQVLQLLDTQTEVVPRNPTEAWDLFLHCLQQKKGVCYTRVSALGEDVESLRSLAKEKYSTPW